MPEITVNGVTLHHETSGSGPSVVLVHGSWGSADDWQAVVPGLAASRTVVVYDRRGHSRSERPEGQGSVHEDAADLAALIEALGVAPALVCGSSYGALITLRLAASRPELLRGIVVHEPPGIGLLRAEPELAPVTAAVEERLAPVRALLEAGEDALAAEVFVETVALGEGAWAQLPQTVRDDFIGNAPTYLDELRDPDALDLDLGALARWTGPAMLSRSDNSAPMFAPVLARIATVLPQAGFHLYRRAGHMPQLTQPEEYVRTVLSVA